MNKRFIALLCITSTFLAITPVFAEFNQETIHVKLGETFEINLPENITTGYSWFMGPFQEEALQLIDTKYVVNNSPGGAIGIAGLGGTRIFTFKAKGIPNYTDGKGRVYLKFVHMGPGKNPTAVEQKMYYIIIKK